MAFGRANHAGESKVTFSVCQRVQKDHTRAVAGRSGSATVDLFARAEAQAFLQQVEREQAAALAAIRDHPFVQGIANGTANRESLRQFAHAEYWYMRGGVKHFALSIMTAPDMETQRFYHQRLSGELEYLERFRPVLQALGLDEQELDRSWPAPQTLSAVNFLFRLSVESGPADKAIAWYMVGRVFAETCRAMHQGLAAYYQMPAEALRFFDIPHVHSAPFVEAIATIIARYAPTADDRAHLRQVAEAIAVYEREFYDALGTRA
jgi:thiaminase